MKKTLKISGIVLFSLIILIIILPFLFKGKIINIVEKQANNSVDATIRFDKDIRLSLLKSFPDFSLTLQNVEIANHAPFDGDTLARVGSVYFSFDVMKAIKGQIAVKTLKIDQAAIYIHILNDTNNFIGNYDIALPSTDTTSMDASEESSNISLPVKSFSITNSRFIYDDELDLVYIDLDQLNLNGKGDFGMSVFDMICELTAQKTVFKYDNIAYLNGVNTHLNAVLNMNLDSMKFTFKENLLTLNKLDVQFDGYLAIPDDIETNLAFKVPSTDFKNLISLVPAIYAHDFESLQSQGSLQMGGFLKGVYSDKTIPAFDINLKVKDGQFKYPDLPKAVKNIQVDLQLSNPDGIINHTLVNLKNTHAEFGNNPVDVSLIAKNIEKDPYVDAKIKCRLNLDELNEMLVLDEPLNGLLQADLALKGFSSSIENEKYEDFYAAGEVSLKDIQYNYSGLEQKVNVQELKLLFSPQFVKLDRCDVALGKSDLSAGGQLENFIPYLFDKGSLKGRLNIASNYFDINPFIPESETEEAPVTTESNDTLASDHTQAVVLPENINFTMNARFNTLIYQEMTLKNAVCNLQLQDQKLEISDLNANVFNGQLHVDGYYSSTGQQNPESGLNLDISGFTFKELFKVSPTVQKFVPIADFIEGDFDASLSLNTLLQNDMMPLLSSLISKGKLKIDQVAIRNYTPVDLVANTLDIRELKNLELKNIRPSYKIKDGRFYLDKPITFSVKDYDFEVSGWNGIDKSIDFDIKVNMPAEKIKSQGSALASQLVKQKINLPLDSRIDVFLKLTGSVDKPEIKISFDEVKSNLKEIVKNQVENKLQEEKTKAEDLAKKELEKKKKELAERKKAEEEKLKKELEQKKKEAEEKAKKELDATKKKAAEEAKKRLKKLFK